MPNYNIITPTVPSNVTIQMPSTSGTLALSGGPDSDEKAKVSSNDTTAGYLNGKLVAGTNITFTENNDGGNETLTIAATVPVTSVNTKTGAVTLNATDVGAAATSHTHAATDITSGVMATARLGTGTANATTYLAGDQTYKAFPKTDTLLTFTSVADIENTTNLTPFWAANVPAGWVEGEIIDFFFYYEIRNNTGSNQNLTLRLLLGGTQVGGDYVATVTNGVNGFNMGRFRLIHRGTFWWYVMPNVSNTYTETFGPGFNTANSNHTLLQGEATGAGSYSFSMRGFWGTASPNLYLRMISVSARKYGEQKT